VLLVATVDGVHGQGGPRGLAGRRVRALAGDADRWWALVEDHEVHRWTGEGPWVEVARAEAELTCLAPVDGALVLGTAGAHLRWLEGSGPDRAVPGFDETPGREDWYTPWGGLPATRSLAVAGDGTLYANVHVGGILRSVDGGRSWAPTIDLQADVHQVCCPRPHQPGLVIAACADGLAVSLDGGEGWFLREVGLGRHTYSRAVAVVGDTVVLSASDGPGGEHAGLYRAPLEGLDRFERCAGDLPTWLPDNVDTGWLAGTDDWAAVVTADGTLYRSEDEGASWEAVAEGLPRPCWLAAR
jgi:photosystem II stability/assembly factor-like uncharacterized protein